jgi:hypothetical protein
VSKNGGFYRILPRPRVGPILILIGSNRVFVRTFRDLGDRILPETLPARYNTKSTLVYDVKPGGNRIDLELTSH